MNKAFSFAISYGLRDFELQVETTLHRRITGVFGPSGSGKTSLLESLAGIRKGVRGRIACGEIEWLNSEQHLNLKLRHRNIGYVPQQHLLFPHLSVWKNLRFGERRALERGLDVNALYADVVKTLELETLIDQPVDQLSGGERQRVALGRALCSGPELLMLDEPLSALDLQLRKRILPFLLRVRDHFEIPMLIVSHQPVDLMMLCDEVLVLRKGKKVAQDTPLKVFSDKDIYHDIVTEGFQNVINGEVEAQELHTSCVRIGNGNGTQTATVIGAHHPVGKSVKLAFSPNDILMSRNQVFGISARNQWAAEVISVDFVKDEVVVVSELVGSHATRVVVHLTPDALDELQLVEGSKVYLILKSSSIEVIG